jgi:hypothetical protein
MGPGSRPTGVSNRIAEIVMPFEGRAGDAQAVGRGHVALGVVGEGGVDHLAGDGAHPVRLQIAERRMQRSRLRKGNIAISPSYAQDVRHMATIAPTKFSVGARSRNTKIGSHRKGAGPTLKCVTKSESCIILTIHVPGIL